jgi:benzoate 4-monooxygenase
VLESNISWYKLIFPPPKTRMALLLTPVTTVVHTTLKGIAVVISACLFFVAVQTVYNLWLHPLRRIPGPPLARVSRLWARIGNFYGRKSERIHAAHERYGPVVRVGPNEVSFSSPDAVHEIYMSGSFVKEETFYRAKRMFHENHLFAFRDPEAHRQRRKMLSRGFSQAAMLDFEASLSTKIQTLLSQWASRTGDGSPIDIYPWCHWLGFDTVYHLMFDEDPGSLNAGQAHEVMQYIRAWKPTFIWKEFFPQLETWGPSVPGPLGNMFRLVRTWKMLATNIIRNCRLKDTKTPFLRGALTEVDPYLGRPLTDSELAEECMGGMFGGSGTTANTFLFLVWAVARDAQIKSRLRQELAEAFPDPLAVPDYTVSCAVCFSPGVLPTTD